MLVALSVATAAAQLSLAAEPGQVAVLALAVIAGATLPPVTSLARAALRSSLTAERRERAFGLESAVSWIPLVVAGGGAYAALACIEVAAVARLEDANYVAIALAAWSAHGWPSADCDAVEPRLPGL